MASQYFISELEPCILIYITDAVINHTHESFSFPLFLTGICYFLWSGH